MVEWLPKTTALSKSAAISISLPITVVPFALILLLWPITVLFFLPSAMLFPTPIAIPLLVPLPIRLYTPKAVPLVTFSPTHVRAPTDVPFVVWLSTPA